MKPRYFNSVMPRYNEIWVGKVLDAEVNSLNGPDIIGKDFDVEVKFTLVGDQCNAQKYPRTWTVFEHQLNYPNGKKMYWGFGTYSLSKPVKEIRNHEFKKIEEIVLNRELWIVPWNFINQYEPHITKGQTQQSNWINILRYPKLKDIPKIIRTSKVKNGKIHLTEGVKLELFDYLLN